MKLKFQYKNGALVLPDTVTEKMDRATEQDLRILLCLAANPYAATDGERAIGEVAERLSLVRATVEVSLSFWRGAGVLTQEETEMTLPEKPKRARSAKSPAAKPSSGAGTARGAGDSREAAKPDGKGAVLLPEKGLPVYSAEELETLIAGNQPMQELLNAAQQVFGKIFNTAEFSVVVGMVDHLGFDGEYVLLILSHCRRMNKKSIRYAEKVALTLHDEGITDARTLEDHLHTIERMAEAEGQIRQMFGIGARQLTAKEKNKIGKWVGVMGLPMDVIRKAYEITVDSTKDHTASVSYANTILERWHAAGYRTLEDVEAALAEYKKNKVNNGSSFDVDEFFAAALKRTYGG